jgi:hypothetical protein
MTKQSRCARLHPVLMAGVAAVLALPGCQTNQRHQVIAVTGTNIGVEVSQNPANQSPQAKLGYQRAEFTIVPTNRGVDAQDKGNGNGALDVPDVVMELKYSGIFDFGEMSGIYQRLAVGSKAVEQPGASLMFVRNAKGEVTANGAAAIAAAKGTSGRDKNSKCIEDWMSADEEKNPPKLRAWLDEKKISTGFTLFVESKELAAARAAAVKDATLGISCN